MNFKSNEPCICCGLDVDGMVCYHHLLTRKARPDLKYDARNMISVCQSHHNLFHSQGTSYMANNFEGVLVFLRDNGWIRQGGKWILYK